MPPVSIRFTANRALGMSFALAICLVLLIAWPVHAASEPTLDIAGIPCIEGVRVTQVFPGSPCLKLTRTFEGGLVHGRLEVGDIITHVNSEAVSTPLDVRRKLSIERNDASITVLNSTDNFRSTKWNVKCNRRAFSLPDVLNQEGVNKNDFVFKAYDVQIDALEIFRLSRKWEAMCSRVASAVANDLNLSSPPVIWFHFEVLTKNQAGEITAVLPRFIAENKGDVWRHLSRHFSYDLNQIHILPNVTIKLVPLQRMATIFLAELLLKDENGNPDFARIGRLFQDDIRAVRLQNGGGPSARSAIYRHQAVYVVSSWQRANGSDGKPAGRYCWRYNTWFRPSADGKDYELSVRVDIGKLVGENEVDEVTHSDFGGMLCQSLRTGIAVKSKPVPLSTKVVTILEPSVVPRDQHASQILENRYFPLRPEGISVPEAATDLSDSILQKLVKKQEK